MAPTTQTNKSTQNQTPAATKQEASRTSRSSINTNQRQPGGARGAEGYKGPDCDALVEAVKHFLPLGSNFNSSKPTGKANCPAWVFEAKKTQKLIDNCAELLALDEESSSKDNVDSESSHETDTQRVQDDDDDASCMVFPCQLSFPPNDESLNQSQVQEQALSQNLAQSQNPAQSEDPSQSNPPGSAGDSRIPLNHFSPYAGRSKGSNTGLHHHTPS
ncbi:hypothetical protein PCANC_20755 [Puccinia coronata f. sp. avenae]|uniref:Uncharacterized protein n=1 Tax=Puccinia coronata f. sp. avenae TaxID=200324 RepID=A0A2N5U6P9_9BASI|nr:hypothetical protein PCANC_20755 [Puccinia coronata f. sp. avenae]